MKDINGFNPGDEIFSEEASLWCTVQDDGRYYVKNGDWYGTPLADGGFVIHIPRHLDNEDGHMVVKDWAIDEEVAAKAREFQQFEKEMKELEEKYAAARAELRKKYGRPRPTAIFGDMFDDDVAF